MGLFKKLFHRCGEHLEYIEGTRFPETGTTGMGKVWKTTDALYAVNSTHHVELNYVGLNFLMHFQFKHLLEETIIKILRNDYFLKSRCKSRFFYFINKIIEIFRKVSIYIL